MIGMKKFKVYCLGNRKHTKGFTFSFYNNYRTVEEKSSSKETSLIAGKSLSVNDHNVVGNDNREGLKTINDWTISSQDPEMGKVQRSADIGVDSKWNRNGMPLTHNGEGEDMILSLMKVKAAERRGLSND